MYNSIINTFGFFSKKEKFKLSLLGFLMLITSALELISLSMIIPIASLFIDSSIIFQNELLKRFVDTFNLNSKNLIYYLIFGFVVVYILKILVQILIVWFEQNFLNKFRLELSNRFFSNYIREDLSFFSGKNSSELLRNIISEIDHFVNYFTSLIKATLEAIILFSILIFLLFINTYVTIICFTLFFLVGFIYLGSVRNKIKNWGYQRQSLDKNRIQFLQEGFGALKEIKIMGRENFFLNNFKLQNSKLAKISFKMDFLSQLPRHILEFIAILTIIITFLVLNNLEISFNETFSLLAVYLAAAFRLMPSSNRLINTIQSLKYTHSAVDVLGDEISKFSVKKDEDLSIEKLKFARNLIIDIEKFHYSNNKKFTISNIKLDIQFGKKIGIIGTSGSGKSTILEIICGILEPTIGKITVDGKNISKNKKSWMKNIAYIPQKIFILDDTLRNNILFGSNNDEFDDNKIKNIIKKINLLPLLSKLPNGLNSKLGEKGANLSVGEVQRVGIARALLRDPELIILDEATSSLDTFTESKILEEIEKFDNKTIISVAHRLGTLKKSDVIYKVENGQIVDQGSFEKFNN